MNHRILYLLLSFSIFCLSEVHAEISLWDEAVHSNVAKYSRGNSTRYRFNMGFGPQRVSVPKTITWFSIESRGGTEGNDCGGLNFGGQLKIMFNKNALEEYLGGLEALVSQLIAGAPMLILQTVAPGLAEAIKHIKSMANMTMRTRMGQCQELYKAASDVGRKIFQEGKADCHKVATANGVTDTGNANESCSDYNRFPSLNAADGKFKDFVNYSEEMQKKANNALGSGNNTLTGNALRGLFGQTDLSVNGKVMLSTRPHDKAQKDKRDKVEEAAKKAEDAIKAIKDGMGTSGITDEQLKALSTPGMPMTTDALVAIAALPEDAQAFYVGNIASVIGHYKQLEELYKMKNAVIQTGEMPDVKKYEEAGLGDVDRVLELINNDIEQLERQILSEERVRSNFMKTLTSIEGQSRGKGASLISDLNKPNKAVDKMLPGHGSMISVREQSRLRIEDGLPPFNP